MYRKISAMSQDILLTHINNLQNNGIKMSARTTQTSYNVIYNIAHKTIIINRGDASSFQSRDKQHVKTLSHL